MDDGRPVPERRRARPDHAGAGGADGRGRRLRGGGDLGGLLAAAIAFAPSFAFVLGGASRFHLLRSDWRARAFLRGAGPAAIGAIIGSAVPLARAISEPWQWGVLGAAAIVLLLFRRGVVTTLVLAGAAGVTVALLGVSLPG